MYQRQRLAPITGPRIGSIAEGTRPINAPIAFLDVEASGLGAASWPVEVGWCFLTGRPRSLLIKPAEQWPDSAWDPQAQALHGLTRQKLARAGAGTETVCAAMNKALCDAAVYSDAPDWDGFWLYRLFQAARVRQQFKLRDFSELFETVSGARFGEAKALAEKKAPHRHRARADVLHMRALFRLAGPREEDAG